MSQHRCTNPGYIMNGVRIQEFASLGMTAFKSIILFLKHILTIAWLNHKKYHNTNIKYMKLKGNANERGVNIYNRKIKNGASKSTEYRHFKDLNKTISEHAKELKMHSRTYKQKWVTYEHNRDNSFFDTNDKLADRKQKQFDKLQKELWQNYHNNTQRITNVTLNVVNRRQSFRDVQESRVAVCLFFLCVIFLYLQELCVIFFYVHFLCVIFLY